MPGKARAVLYAKDTALLKAFYQQLLSIGDDAVRVESSHVTISTANLDLILVAIPTHIAQSIVIESPPEVRSDVPVKLVFDVANIAHARVVAPQHGGEVWSTEREWDFGEFRVCDARDPEGNVIQLAQMR